MDHAQSAAGRQRDRLLAAMTLSVGILFAELAAGVVSHSLALLADAAHVFADISGMALALAAIWIANRPTSGARTYGLYRAEILAAGLNAVLLLAVSAVVMWEGIQRLMAPSEVGTELMVAVAALALVANLGSLALLRRGQAESITLRGAYLEVLGDAAGAATVLAAGIVIALTGLRGADGLAAIAIGALILPRTGRLLRDSIDVLLEATPKGVHLDEVRAHMLEAPGVEAVHDLHVWTITSGMNVVSAHIVMSPDANPGALLDHLGECLSGDFDIGHSTFQLETPEHVLWEGRAQPQR
ncbi:MAG TPA: cation diffusion facilitator family transporter [Candidatus Saccharimonadales bacterium]|nr:cation diffusion facilitator family transporter [Candidatus Saccharimonadales bacterium]